MRTGQSLFNAFFDVLTRHITISVFDFTLWFLIAVSRTAIHMSSASGIIGY